MAVQLTYQANVSVLETIATGVPAVTSQNARVTHDQFNTLLSLDANTTVPVTKVAAFTKTLAAGVATIDLTALTGTNGVTVDGTGLKLQALKVKATSTNANTWKIAVGSSNGYNLLSSAFSATLSPGQEITIYGNDAAPDIAAGAKVFDCTGTSSQTADVIAVMG